MGSNGEGEGRPTALRLAGQAAMKRGSFHVFMGWGGSPAQAALLWESVSALGLWGCVTLECWAQGVEASKRH